MRLGRRLAVGEAAQTQQAVSPDALDTETPESPWHENEAPPAPVETPQREEVTCRATGY